MLFFTTIARSTSRVNPSYGMRFYHWGALLGYVLAFTRYCHYTYCMVYGINKEGRRGVSCVAQSFCNRIAIVWAMQAGGA